MRTVVIAAVILLAVVSVGALADVTAPFARVDVGSYSSTPRSDGLQAVSDEPGCQRVSGSPCALRYAYRPNQKLTVWFSVRNEGRVAVTLDGVPGDWFAKFLPDMLIRPVASLDGGDPARGIGDRTGVPFRSIALAPRAERILGVELRTTADVAFACAHWETGTAVGLEQVPVTWHWALTRHEEKIALARPIQLMAPASSDCGR